MKPSLPQFHSRLLTACLTLALLPSLPLSANTAIEPVPRTEPWLKRHEGFVETAQNETACQALFLGDSITDAWRSKGLEGWRSGTSISPR